MIKNQFEHLFGEFHTSPIDDKFDADRYCTSSSSNHEFSMIRENGKLLFCELLGERSHLTFRRAKSERSYPFSPRSTQRMLQGWMRHGCGGW